MGSANDIPDEGALEQFGEIVRSGIEAYKRSPVLRMFVMLCPPLAVAEAGILSTYEYFQRRRVEVFADEFTTFGLSITEEDAKRREFFDAFTSTAGV